MLKNIHLRLIKKKESSMAEKAYSTDAITVTYDVKRCIHAAACVKGLRAVFNPDQKPWVQPQHAAPTEVAEVIHRCPSGALHYQRHDGGAAEATPAENTVQLDPNGPLYLRGRLEVKTAAGEALLQETRLALCRCGASQNKPFCDNSHRQINFTHAGTLNENRLKAGEAQDPTLTISPAANGPLLIKGPLSIHSADGQQHFSGIQGALCRCGHSENKPFCDGTHKKIAFQAE
jgi:CDGSH-type Zn-finger protein/uncharacterized Fe-S cluster protein YjdI